MKICTECMKEAANETSEFLGEMWTDFKKTLPSAKLVESVINFFGGVGFFTIMLAPLFATYAIMSPNQLGFFVGVGIFIASFILSIIYGIWFICLQECRTCMKWEAENTINMDKPL